LSEYEKSVLLTKAQDEIVKNYFYPEGNAKQKGYDDNPKRQTDFSMLTVNATCTIQTGQEGKPSVDPRAYVFLLPDDIMFIINESVQFANYITTNPTILGIRQVIPLSYSEYTTLMSKPFKEPLKYQAWRLNVGNKDMTTGEGTEAITTTHPLAEIILTSTDKSEYIGDTELVSTKMKYVIRYVKKPEPIILVNLSPNVFGENLYIHGKQVQTPCKLDPSIHEEIVQRAVELAKVAWSGDLNASLAAGQRSE
jgi:hypothetical protein